MTSLFKIELQQSLTIKNDIFTFTLGYLILKKGILSVTHLIVFVNTKAMGKNLTQKIQKI